jgi:hypothetical protein
MKVTSFIIKVERLALLLLESVAVDMENGRTVQRQDS